MLLNKTNKQILRSCIASSLLGLTTNSVIAEDMPPCPMSNGVTLEDFLPESCEDSLIGVDQSDIRFATIDNILGNRIRFGMARYNVSSNAINTCSVGIENDNDDDDDFDPVSLSDIEQGQQVAFLIDDPDGEPRRINQLWVLNCSIVQER